MSGQNTNNENIKECIEKFEDKLEIGKNTNKEGIIEEAKYLPNQDAYAMSKRSAWDDPLNNLSPFSIGMQIIYNWFNRKKHRIKPETVFKFS